MTTPFPTRWPVEHPDRLQLYSLATPNGQKAGIALEELGLPYEAHMVDIGSGQQHEPEYRKISPNGKIPAVVDPRGPDGEPVVLMESGAILLYLARKAGRLVPQTPREEAELLQWMFFQVGHVGPMFGQFGHFYKFAKGKTDQYGEQRYGAEVTRLLGVLDEHLADREWLVGEFGLADIMTVPWINSLDFYEGKEFVDYGRFTHVQDWVARFMARPAVQRGVKVCNPEA